MRINGYRCDGCGEEYLLAPYYTPQMHGDSLPDEWCMLTKPNLSAIEQPRFFCGLSCVEQWVTNANRGVVDPPRTQRRLTLILRFDLLVMQEGYIHARGRTVHELFAENFPGAEKFNVTVENASEISVTDWKYTLADACDEHIEWAEMAKKLGLIDHYVVDEVTA